MRGDVPKVSNNTGKSLKFSPRARGCSYGGVDWVGKFWVFPACAGMFRRHTHYSYHHRGFPRVRGDVPANTVTAAFGSWFSPRARGCSGLIDLASKAGIVFPACAGMFPFGWDTGM